MEYRFDPSASKPGAAPALTAAAAAQLQVRVPFTLRASPPSPTTAVRPSSHPSTLNNHLTTNLPGNRRVRAVFTPRGGALEDVAVELYLGSGATGGGEWIYVPARRTPRWSLAPSTSTTSGVTSSASAPGRTATLRGTFSIGDAHPRPACAAQISFTLPAGALLSAPKMDKLKLSGETY